MSFPLPPALSAAIEKLAAGMRQSEVVQRTALISAQYREGKGSQTAIASEDDVAAYLLARMPATFAAASASLRAASELMPSFSPSSLLDLCAGPGTASFAALSLWPEISTVTMVDANPFFLAAAQSLGVICGTAAMRQAKLIRSRFAAVWDELPSAELVVMSYALVELDQAIIAELSRRIWSRSKGLLLFVEPGTPEGFRRILVCRNALIEEGAHLAAPCPHVATCPMPQHAWCHFTERLPRSRQHRLAKGAQVNFEDEPYIYLAFSRSGLEFRPRGRIVSRVRVSKADVRFTVCGEGGRLTDEMAPRRERGIYAKMRRA
ncbi:MAG: SAM-dependent methyltransferase, partial [Hyphomicrobiales bacterium]|nr:SAM-dependent methyltransferase [Hyphomicrobiales bacterium]